MSFSYLQGAQTLQRMTTAGALTSLTLPAGVTLSSTRRPRWAILGENVLMVHSPERPLWMKADTTTVRLADIRPPVTAVTLTAIGTGTLSGTFRVRASFLVKDTETGQVLFESALGPESEASATLASQLLRVQNIPIAAEVAVNARRLYRTTTGPGAVYFAWIDIDDNTQTDIRDDMADAQLSLLPAPFDLGMIPESLKLITSWRDRLWAVSDRDPHFVWYSGDRKFYGWPSVNKVPIPPLGEDEFGVMAFAPRQDELGVLKRDAIHKITSFDETTFRRSIVKSGVGCIAPESVVTVDDITYFLGEDGVYEWTLAGVQSITDDRVHAWFNTTTYFQRASLIDAVGRYNNNSQSYELLLPATGAATLNRWISWDIGERLWLGPHLTANFTPNYMATLEDADDLSLPVICSTAGTVFQEQSTRTDGITSNTQIVLDVDTGFMSTNTPDIHKLFLQPTLISKVQNSGTLTITPTVGGLDAIAGQPLRADMTKGRERLPRLGVGRFVQLNFVNRTAGEDIEIFGYELPWHELGRR